MSQSSEAFPKLDNTMTRLSADNTAAENNAATPIRQTGLADLDYANNDSPAWLTDALAVPREQGVVSVEGCDINYFRWGDPSKPGIVMLHGFLSHARCFAFIAPYLAADYHIVAYDMSGMGDSGVRESYPDEIRVRELLEVASHTGMFDNNKVPTIIAHSYGGRIGTSAMHAHPEKFSGIIICDLMILRPSVLEANSEKFKPPGNQKSDRPNRIYPDYDTAKARFVLAPPQKVGQAELFDFIAYHSLKKVEGGWQWKFDPSVFKREAGFESAWAKTGENVVKIPGRKAIVYGQQSLLFSRDSVEFVKELVTELGEKNIPIVEIPDAGHHLMLDQPMALVTALKTFLALWAESEQ